jgi:hypothetical protein
VHERVQRIPIDDEVALARDQEHLTAAARKITSSELLEPELSAIL